MWSRVPSHERAEAVIARRVVLRPLRVLRTVALAVFLALVLAPVARAADPIMPLDQVHAGMRCTGLTVVHGVDIASFDVDVIDVVAGQPPEDPRILIRVSGPTVEGTGVAEGFSGSPVVLRRGGRRRAQRRRGLGDRRPVRRDGRAGDADRADARRALRSAGQPPLRAGAAAQVQAAARRPHRLGRVRASGSDAPGRGPAAATARSSRSRRARWAVIRRRRSPPEPRWQPATRPATSPSPPSAPRRTRTATSSTRSVTRSTRWAGAGCCWRTPTCTR